MDNAAYSQCEQKVLGVNWNYLEDCLTLPLVVMEMVILGTSSNYQNCIKSTNNKIPEYARDYKKEYLYIRGLNKEFKYFINKLDDLNNGLFESNISNRLCYLIKRFLRGQEKGKLKDISNLMLQRDDLNNLIFINEQFGYYKLRYDAFCDDSDDNDYYSDDDSDDDGNGEYLVDGKPYPGFKEIYDIFKLFFNQIKYEGCDSDSDSDSDIEDFDIVLPDSDDDSDSDNF